MKTVTSISTLILIVVLFAGCSKLKNELTEPPSPTIIHAAGWSELNNSEFHGNYLKENSWKLINCIQCHASNYEGGTSNVSCYNCHESYPHKSGWMLESSLNYHGLFLENEDWSAAACKSCHGSDLQGGNTGVKCATCHESFPHQVGWKQTNDANFHGQYIKTDSWEMFKCTGCHGSDYNGGAVTDVSCMASNCHVDQNNNKKSPEACNTCHGVFTAKADSALTWSPPKSVNGESSTSVKGVGAHQKHLATGTFGKTVKCSECHSVPSQTFVSGHLDSNLPAEVVMNDTLARLITANGLLVPNPIFNSSTFSCQNTYCHGNWRLRRATSTVQFAYADTVMVGANYSPLWTGGSPQATCGSCHALPPTGHIPATPATCVNCHTGIVNGSGVIIDKEKHINGKINVFGSEKNMN
jgi:predicted CxxxxCH...CXXCH cytochrome family protein